MRNALRACAAAVLASVPFLAQAQAAPAAAAKPEPEFTFTGNAGLFSDYRFRGYSQTDYKPAFQGGFDFAHKSGFYAGNWNSNVEQSLYTGANLEMDFYAGFKGSLGDFGYDIGYLYYFYPGSGVADSTKIKNGEVYLGGSYGPVSANDSLNDLIGKMAHVGVSSADEFDELADLFERKAAIGGRRRATRKARKNRKGRKATRKH